RVRTASSASVTTGIATIGQIVRGSFVLIAIRSRREKWAARTCQQPLFRRSSRESRNRVDQSPIARLSRNKARLQRPARLQRQARRLQKRRRMILFSKGADDGGGCVHLMATAPVKRPKKIPRRRTPTRLATKPPRPNEGSGSARVH